MSDKLSAEKTRYSDEELEEFRLIVENRISQAREQLAFLESQLVELAESEEGKTRNLDDVVGSSELDRLVTLVSRQKKLIVHLENALLRIENKVYGICRETGKLISKERLKAVPHATLSIVAKQKRRR